jgi:hypothetical protein
MESINYHGEKAIQSHRSNYFQVIDNQIILDLGIDWLSHHYFSNFLLL